MCVLQCIAVCCSECVLQCIAVCCSDCTDICIVPEVRHMSKRDVCVAVYCSVLQCVAVTVQTYASYRRYGTCVAVNVCCSVLQCLAVSCSVLQCLAVSCIVREVGHMCQKETH